MIISIRGSSRNMQSANEILGGDAMNCLVEIGPSIEFLNPQVLDTLTGLGLVIEINRTVYEEGLAPHPSYIPQYDEDEDEGEDDGEEFW